MKIRIIHTQILDGKSHEKSKNAIAKFVQNEELCMQSISTQIEKVTLLLASVSQEHDTHLFKQENAVLFEAPSQFVFERYGGDIRDKVKAHDVNRVALSIRYQL